MNRQYEPLNAAAEKVEKIVQELKRMPAVIDVVLLGRDGSVIAPARDKEAHLKRFSAAVAPMTGGGDEPLGRFLSVGAESILLEGKDCALVVISAGQDAVMMMLVNELDVLDDLKVLAEMKTGRIRELLG